jgi:hypothetical protein
MLFLHEVHAVVGAEEDGFEAAWREYAARLAEGDGARLLWYLHHAHGTGPAYHVVTVTAVRDAGAWEELAERVAAGDLRDWFLEVDGRRHEAEAKVLRPVPWSPLQEVDLASVPPAGAAQGERSLFMEDTAWPHRGRFADYLALAGTTYVETLRRAGEAGRSLLRLEAAFVPAFGTGVGREVVLWQRIVRPEGLTPLFSREVPEEHRRPGTWMHDALDVRDRWRSRILRAATWSPCA